MGYRPQNGDNATPSLKLSGKWLREAGFDTGTGVTVRVTDGCIVLIPDSDEVQQLRQQLQLTQQAVKRMANEAAVAWDCGR